MYTTAATTATDKKKLTKAGCLGILTFKKIFTKHIFQREFKLINTY